MALLIEFWREHDMPGNNETKLSRDRFNTMAFAHIDSIYRFAWYMVQDDKKIG